MKRKRYSENQSIRILKEPKEECWRQKWDASTG